jgi:hypothetical protein
MISEALSAYAIGARVLDERRASTVGASEVGQCARRIFFLKNEADRHFNIQRDAGHVDNWGAAQRGTVFENHFWVPALRAKFGDALKFAGDEQRTFESGFISATPDALLADVPADALAPLGVPDIDSDCLLLEGKTVDPRVKLDAPKLEHRYQAIVQLGVVREVAGWAPQYTVLSYADASFWSDVTEFAIKFDPAIYDNAKRRATKIMTAEKPGDLPPEGWIAGGHECRYCPFTKACGIERHAVPGLRDAGEIDPQFVAEVRDLVREAKRHQGDTDASTTRLREVQHEIRERLRAKQVRRVDGEDFSVVWSPVKGRHSYDMTALKAAALAAGVNVAEFETTGEPTDRLDIRMRDPAHPSKSGG